MFSKSIIILFSLCLFCDLTYGTDPYSDEALNHYNEGVRAQMNGDAYNAQTNYQRSILLNDTYKKFILNNFGVMHANNEELKEAEFVFKEALKIDPNYDGVIDNLSLLYWKLYKSYKYKGDLEKALENLEKAFPQPPMKSFIIEDEKDINGDNSRN